MSPITCFLFYYQPKAFWNRCVSILGTTGPITALFDFRVTVTVLLVHLWCYTWYFSATLSFDLDEFCVRMMSLSPDGRIIVLGGMKYGNKWLFMEYNVHTGARLRTSPLQEDDQPNGMTMVNVAGNQCIAVSYRYFLSGLFGSSPFCVRLENKVMECNSDVSSLIYSYHKG